MEIIIVAVAILAVAAYFILRKSKEIPESVLKTEQASPTPVVDPLPAGTEASVAAPAPVSAPTFVPPVTTAVQEANILDLNNDGKVNLEDAKEAVKKTVAKAKTATSRAKKKK
jgi:hypothetical protein